MLELDATCAVCTRAIAQQRILLKKQERQEQQVVPIHNNGAQHR